MIFNTVILYDIENLIGGYSNASMLSHLSLKNIHQEILKKDIGKIAIQRAYANWSDPRLNFLRTDIIELGIEPIQMFGFGRGAQKNASDIQLAIDAIDIALTKKAIEIVIIVSGDGGFSALAKKLHEYGKMVIGCAFKRSTNRIFEAVCDDFIWIEEPKDENGQTLELNEFTDPILIDFARKYKPVTASGGEVIELSFQIIDFLATNKDAKLLLENVGLNISIFSQMLSYRISNFNYLILGFIKFVDFIRYVTNNRVVKLVCNPPSEYRLLYFYSSIEGFESVEPLTELREIHSLENYKLLLTKGVQRFIIPSSDIVFNLVNHLSAQKLNYQNLSLSDVAHMLSLEYSYEPSDIKNCVKSLVFGDCFTKKPKDAKLSEQKLSFIYDSYDETIKTLKEAMHRKLEELLGEVKDDIFEQIFT